MLNFLSEKINNHKLQKKWRRLNPNNETFPANKFDFSRVKVGNYTYGELTVLNFGKYNSLRIGNFCSIASGVIFNVCSEHRMETVSTFPFKVKCLYTEENEALSRGDIVVEDDVWIGQNAIIMSGVTLGRGCVVGAGSVVTKSIPPYAVAVGVPAKVIKYRFKEEVIEQLMKVDFSKLSKETIEKNITELYKPVEFKKLPGWLPIK